MKKILSLTLPAMLLLGMLAGCGTEAEEPSAPPVESSAASGVSQTVDNTMSKENPVEGGYDITVWVGTDMVLETQGECWDEYMATFLEENDKCNSITLVPMGDAERLTGIMAGVGLPDIFFGSARDALKYYQAVDLLDLGDLFADTEWSDGFYDSAIEHVTYDGSQYAIPLISYVSIMYRNREIVEASGCELPEQYTTMDEFIDTLKAVSDAGYVATQSWALGSYYGTGTIAGSDAANITVGIENNKTTIQPEQLVRTFETLMEIEQYANNMPYGEDATIESFCAGEIAFLLDGPWTEYTIQASGVDYDVILMPPYEEGGPTGGMQGWDYYYGVDSGDEERNAVIKDLLKYLGSFEAEKLWTVKVGRPTLREDVMSDPEVLQTMMCQVQALGNEGGILQMDFFHDNVFWMSVFSDVAPLVIDGTYTPEEGAQASIDAVNALYAEQG